MIDKALVRKHFDRHAFEYDQFAHVQQRMATEMYELTAPYFPSHTPHLLEIGCGTGLLTLKLATNHPDTDLTLLDISGEMLKQTSEKLGPLRAKDTFRLIESDAEEWAEEHATETACYDVIISGATFQWFNRPLETIQQYWKRLKPGGIFAFSTFCSRTFEELHDAFKAAEKKLALPPRRRGQSFMSLQEWDKLFKRMEPQSKQLEMKEMLQQESYDSVRHFLTHVKRVGAGNASRHPEEEESHGGVFSRKLFRQMEKMYDHRFGLDGIIPATYHIGYFVYQKQGDEHE